MRDFLLECYKVEKLAAKVYTKFAGNPSYPKAVCELFQKLAADELEHSRVIDLVMQTPEQELDATPALSTGEVDEMLELANALLAEAERGNLSANEALEFALRIEHHLVQVHANNALEPKSERLGKFFKELAQYDRAHVDQIQACINT